MTENREKVFKILVINPGSTSTKVSLFENELSRFEKSLFHDAPVLLQYPHVNDQIPFRYGVILDMLKEEGVDPREIDVFVGRGGSAHTQPGGVTAVDQRLYEDMWPPWGAASILRSWGSCWPGSSPGSSGGPPIP